MSTQKRFILICIVTTNIIFILACQSVANVLSPVTPTPDREPDVSATDPSYDGDWEGTTSQDLKLEFTVAHNAIVTLVFQATWIGAGCISGTNTTSITLDEPTYPIQNGSFTITKYADSIDGTSYTVSGNFSSPKTASGTLEYVASGTDCDGTKKVNWVAEKIIQ